MNPELEGTITASELCSMIDITPVTLRSWKARWKERGIRLLPEAEGWSRYTFLHAMQATLVADLTELKLNPVDVGYHVTDISAFQDDVTYLVIAKAPLGVSTTGYAPGHTYSILVRERELIACLSDPNKFGSIVCNIDTLEHRVSEAWKALKRAK